MNNSEAKDASAFAISYKKLTSMWAKKKNSLIERDKVNLIPGFERKKPTVDQIQKFSKENLQKQFMEKYNIDKNRKREASDVNNNYEFKVPEVPVKKSKIFSENVNNGGMLGKFHENLVQQNPNETRTNTTVTSSEFNPNFNSTRYSFEERNRREKSFFTKSRENDENRPGTSKSFQKKNQQSQRFISQPISSSRKDSQKLNSRYSDSFFLNFPEPRASQNVRNQQIPFIQERQPTRNSHSNLELSSISLFKENPIEDNLDAYVIHLSQNKAQLPPPPKQSKKKMNISFNLTESQESRQSLKDGINYEIPTSSKFEQELKSQSQSTPIETRKPVFLDPDEMKMPKLNIRAKQTENRILILMDKTCSKIEKRGVHFYKLPDLHQQSKDKLRKIIDDKEGIARKLNETLSTTFTSEDGENDYLSQEQKSQKKFIPLALPDIPDDDLVRDKWNQSDDSIDRQINSIVSNVVDQLNKPPSSPTISEFNDNLLLSNIPEKTSKNHRNDFFMDLDFPSSPYQDNLPLNTTFLPEELMKFDRHEDKFKSNFDHNEHNISPVSYLREDNDSRLFDNEEEVSSLHSTIFRDSISYL